MRYRIDPGFWQRLEAAGITPTDLAAGTPHSRNWIYQTRRRDRTVSRAWINAVLAKFPLEERTELAALFHLVEGSERYRILLPFWGLLAMRRISFTRLGNVVGVTSQRLSVLRRNPTWTISQHLRDQIVNQLALDNPDSYFELVEELPGEHFVSDWEIPEPLLLRA